MFLTPVLPVSYKYPPMGKFLSLLFVVIACAFAGGGQIAHARTFLNCEKVFLEMGDENSDIYTARLVKQ